MVLQKAPVEESVRDSIRDVRTSVALAEHFLNGRQLGAVFVIVSIVGSSMSGYTLVGVPADFAALGWNGSRWFASFMAVPIGAVFVTPRLRRLALKRSYVSPLDFIVDRFRSPTLHVWCAIALAGPTLVYLTAQVISLIGLADGMFQGLLPAFPTAVVLCMFMVGYEWAGGMAAIAYTDVFQTSVMFFGSIVAAFVIADAYGGFSTIRNRLKDDEPSFFEVPSHSTQLGLFNFTVAACFYVFNGFFISTL